MCGTLRVLGLTLYVGLAHSWNLAVSHGDLLEFYTNDTKTTTVRFDSRNLGSLAYDEVHNTILYVDKQSDGDTICGYVISSMENVCFIEINGRNIHGIAFDPATELLFFSDTEERSINWISLKSGSPHKSYGNLLILLEHGIPTDVAVDSCRGFIYWINTNLSTPTIERVRFNGNERQIIMKSNSVYINTTYQLEPHSLTIDQETQSIYWIEPENNIVYNIYYSDLNGHHKIYLSNLYMLSYKFTNPSTSTLAVSKSTLFETLWCSECPIKVAKLGKLRWSGATYLELHTKNKTVSIVANYKIKEQIQDVEDCVALVYFKRKKPDGMFCVHGLKVIGQPFCKCTLGYVGERCDVSVCDNSYCLYGNCNVNDEGLPECRCDAGYYGERCEVDVCNGYCLNNGVCSLNEEDEPSCECFSGYEGTNCEVVQTVTSTLTNNPSYSTETSQNETDLLSHDRNNISKICFFVDHS